MHIKANGKNSPFLFITRKHRLISFVFLFIVVILCIWMLTIWLRSYELPGYSEKNKKVFAEYQNKGENIPPSSFYNVITEKDLFSPSRQRYKEVQKQEVAKQSSPVILSQPKKPPPQLTLVGTVLHGDKKTAIISSASTMHRPSSFGVGDGIEGFVIKDIQDESVILEGEGELLEVFMRKASNTNIIQTTTSQAPSGLGTGGDAGRVIQNKQEMPKKVVTPQQSSSSGGISPLQK